MKIFEKALIYAFLSIYEDFILVKGVLLILTVMIYSIASYRVKPYKSKRLNYYDYLSSNACCVSFLLGIFLHDNYFEYFLYPTYIFLGVSNNLFYLILFRF